jgi:hypothetical protein
MTSLTNISSERERLRPWHFRYVFLDTPGLGVCVLCHDIGPIGKICLPCTVSEQHVTLGTCFACKIQGPVWEPCEWCFGGETLPPIYGMCDECWKKGRVGERCPCGWGFFEVESIPETLPRALRITDIEKISDG